MPAFATHEIFGEDGMEGSLSSELTGAVVGRRTVFCMGCQGPDIFFYNPFLSAGRREVNLGSRMHETRMNRFFQVYLEELLRVRERQELEIGISYFLGFLSHYTLDTELHPYIYSRIGYVVEEASTGSTLPLHHRLEAVMDMKMLMVKRECMPSTYYPEKRVKISKQELEVIARLLSRAVQRVYGVLIKPRHVRESYRWMRVVIKQVYDHSGYRKSGSCRRKPPVCYVPVVGNMTVSDFLEDTLDVMNRRGTSWSNPWDKDKPSDESVWELYDNALERFQNYGQDIEPLLLGMFKRITLLEKKQSRAECVREALAAKIPEVVKGLENRNYHSNQSIDLKRI